MGTTWAPISVRMGNEVGQFGYLGTAWAQIRYFLVTFCVLIMLPATACFNEFLTFSSDK